MVSTQNETGSKAEGRWRRADGCRVRTNAKAHPYSLSSHPSGFTLTELLIVIAIIGTLMALLLVAVQGGLTKAKQAEITLEMQNMGGAIEDLRNELGAYPPNGMNNGNRAIIRTVSSDFERMFKKAFPRHNEPRELILALAAASPRDASFQSGAFNVELPQDAAGENVGGGLTGAEAVCFWLGGFSEDSTYPISGIGGPSFADGDDSGAALNATDEVLEDRNLRYEFDLTRFGPRDDNGVFSGRYITYDDPRDDTIRRRINLWTYTPGDSRIPVYYYDTSRHDPEDYDVDMTSIAREGVYAIKQLARRGHRKLHQAIADIRWVEDGTFQLLACWYR